MTEKRRHRRRRIQLDVELVYPGGGSRRFKTLDLSIGGVFVAATGHEPPNVGTILTITFLAMPHEGAIKSIKAKVQRLTHNGIAMTFIDFGLDDHRFIESILFGSSGRSAS